jgi:hypothetical protein
MERETLDIPNSTEETHPNDDDNLLVQQTPSGWDERTWADSIIKQ